ncbi:hypothetical protein RU92_GL001582 [Lactococcus cremoris subsp. tructae]|uniref:Uncharacterized protein n=1 Tax=Lactococcus cremoris subsp. tructae TaxID=542833 RepID=A0A2A5SVY9_LACLC|nr:hypothetical protein RU92_GL001582 [Lactococcus cremoris subsp. tructae]
MLLSQGVQADTKGIVRPSDKYPLGAATMATFYAGENMVINTNYPTNGEFYAGHFYSGTSLSSDGKTELGPGSINDLSKYTGKLPNNLDPMFISPTAFSPAITKSLAETQSLRGNQGETYHYVMGATKADEFTDNQLNSIFNNNEYKTAFTNKAYKKSNGETAHLGDIDYFKDNGVVNQSSGIQNVTTVSDYYDNLTASTYDSEGNITGYKLAVFNDAIKSVTVNSQMVKDPIWTSPSLIQININMDETKTNTGVVAVDIDGKANNGIFQNSEEVSINLLNYDSSKQKIPYIILNYHNFNQFNFENTSIFRVSAYTSEQVKRDNPDVNQFYLKDDRLNLSSTKDNAQRYNTASHIINNFNTITGGEDSTIQINNDKTDDGFSFLGTLLAPHTNISVNSTTTQGFAGNIVTGRSLYLLSDITADNAFSANFNSDGDFPGTSDLEPDANTPPRILSIDLPDNVSFSPENATTHYKFEFSLNNNIQVDPESQTMHRLDGRKVKNTFNIEQPANSSSNLWSRMNDGQWKKYEKEAIAANDQDSAQTTQLSIADVTEDLKTADGKDNYDDQTLYDGGQIDASYDVDGQQKAFIGQHLLHRNKFSFIVARKEDDLSTMSQEEIDNKYSNTMAVYTLEVHGDLLVNYPKIFDFGTYQLGTSGLANNEFRVAKGQINVENPYYLDWKLLVKNTTTEIQNNPLLLDSATDFNAQLYNLVSDTDDTWLPGAFVNLGSLKATGEQTMLVLSTEPDNSVDSNWTEVQPTSSMQFYKTDVELKFHTNRADGYVKRTGSYKLNASWELTTPNIIKK